MSNTDKDARNKLSMTQAEFIEKTAQFRQGTTFNPMTGGYTTRPNPAYRSNVFDPNAYLPNIPVSSDPKLTDPLPDGRYIDPAVISPQNAARMSDIQAFLDNPEQYIADNAPQIVQEQSLIDRGKSMLSNLFDYRDDADLSVFGLNLSPVESVWDGALRHITGAYDLLSIGFGGLISAAPGGVDTISYDALSGGKTVGEVLNGEMEPGSAPSPGQIAVTSVALEAKRIREGNARLSDILLANPATGPFILAGLLADTSPVQADGFDLLNKQQRDAAFGSGWEQWMTGITDAGLMFADPAIGAGVAFKVARQGMLGARAGAKTATEIGVGLDNAANEVLAAAGSDLTMERIFTDAAARQQTVDRAMGDVVQQVMDGEDIARMPVYDAPRITVDMPKPEFQNPLSEMLYNVSLHTTDEATGELVKVWDVKRIESMPEIAQLPNKGTVASLLHEAQDPVIASLIWQYMTGTPGAGQRLMQLAPYLGDSVMRYNAERLTFMRATEPAKLRETGDLFEKQAANIRQQADTVAEKRDALMVDGKAPTTPNELRLYDDLNRRHLTLEQNLDEVRYLQEVITEGRIPDPLDMTNPFTSMDQADNVIRDLLGREDVVTKALRDELKAEGTGLGIKAVMQGEPLQLLWKDNRLSKMARASRERRGTARYQYAMEGTSILPKAVQVGTVLGKNGENVPVIQKTGWFAPSVFEGTSRLQRNMRVWRWLGEETPSGYIGLKGVNTVGAENEFTAATNIDIYKGAALEVTLPSGEVIKVGGTERRAQLFNTFYAALNDPAQDSLKALQQVEKEIADDLSRAYGLVDDAGNASDTFARWAAKNGKQRDLTIDQIRQRGFFVDSVTGEINWVPYLKSQLANGTYMLNYQALEKSLKQELTKGGAGRLKAIMSGTGHYAAEADRMFQAFWRPAALLRFSYTQRNVFEGMLRAMAYNASLAPLSWPVRATVNGTRNAIMRRSAARYTAQARKAIDESNFRPFWDEYVDASSNHLRLAGAVEMPDGNMLVIKRSESGEAIQDILTPKQYEKAMNEANSRLAGADQALADNAEKFTSAIKGTKFDKWRQREITDVNRALAEKQAQINQWAEVLNERDMDGNFVRIEDAPEVLPALNDILLQADILKNKLQVLQYRPIDAMAEYQAFAGRQRRIGSGTSIGPDGGYYNDAFTGPWEQLNRQAMSADSTTKQTLSVDSTRLGNFFTRLVTRTNQPVAYTAATRNQWAEGMARVIEDASSNDLIRVLDEFNWDVDKATDWLINSKEADTFLNGVAHFFDAEGSPVIGGNAVTRAQRKAWIGEEGGDPGRLAPFFTNERTTSGSVQRVFDPEQARAYVAEVATIVRNQMMDQPGFWDVLRRRMAEKSPRRAAAASGVGVGARAADPKEILRIVDSLNERQRMNLGFVQGSEVVQAGHEKIIGLWQKFTNKAFEMLGTIPEDAVVRGPFYNTRFKAARNDLIEAYWADQGQSLKNVRKAKRKYAKETRNRAGVVQDGTISHEPFQIPAGELSRIEYQAHRRALADTREYMYTIERRTNVGKYGEWMFPFISATQNSTVVAGKLLWKEPWLAPMVADLWQMPSRVGFEDENGNLQIAMPFPFVRDFLADHPEIPFLGGALDSSDNLIIPKDGLNVFMPDTGFGLAPRPAPWVQVGASEMMKAGAFPVETPQVLKDVMGAEAADQFYQMTKDYVFGTQGSMSEKTLSYDLLLPATVQRFVDMKDTLGASWGYQYALQRATQYMRWKAGDRDTEPTHQEIEQRTTNMFWFQLAGNMGIPTPLTPFPTLTRTQVRSATQELVDVYQKYKQVDPQGASLAMMNMFGDWGLQSANTKITANVGGADPTTAAASDIKTFDTLIRRVTDVVGESNYDMVGMIVNNRSVEYDYNQSAYDFEKATIIPGTSRKFREVQTPEEAQRERERVTGWTIYRKAMDTLDARLASMGLKSYESAGAANLKAAKDRLVANMANNPDLEGWWIDYQDVGGNRTNAAVRTLELAISDPTFVGEMTKAGKDRLISAMNQYVQARRGVIMAVQQSGKGINEPENWDIKQAWANIRQNLKNSDERWAAIADRYLTADDNPQYPGNFMLNDMAVAETMGASNG